MREPISSAVAAIVRSVMLVAALLASALAVHAQGTASNARAHVVAVNQVGYETAGPKRFTAPVSPDGTRFEVRKAGGEAALFSGEVKGGVGDFSAFRPADDADEYVIAVSGGTLAAGRSDPFAIRGGLYKEQFWQAAVDFMVDSRSVVGTHPSAYGGCAWRDGTYYDFVVPSLVLMYLADPARIQSMPVQMHWAKDKARVLAPAFVFDAKNPHSEGVMDTVKRYYTELDPPRDGAPDVVQMIHWGLGYYLLNPATKDPSGDPLPRQIHGETVEQFAYLLFAWPKLKAWLPQSFHDRAREFAFKQWENSRLFEIDPMWDSRTYVAVADLTGPNPTGGYLHPYKGRHAPGHAIQPNLMMYEVATREGDARAGRFLEAAQRQAQWVIDRVDWNDPRTTKGQRMSEFKTIAGLVWFLQEHPAQAPAGLKAKITDWARVMVERSGNMWDFRRFDLDAHWTIPKLNEPGNLAGFPAIALAASWVVDDDEVKRRLREVAVAQLDNLFGRNPQLAASANHPEKGFPLVERGWPHKFPENVCARLETTRGSLSASPGSEKYPFTPDGEFRHSEGWVNFNAAWNVSLAYLSWDAAQIAGAAR
jgi:hypothetical protein